LGFGPNRVRSLPDGVAQVLAEYMENRAEHITSLGEESEPDAQLFTEESELGNINHNSWEKARDQQTIKIGDICPECGQAAVINEEGCRKCYACGYSEC
jgi:ribonucleoside-diphosphate reductase alpha chain